MSNQVIKVAAFSDGDIGGNPAGVLISDQHPSAAQMQAIAAEVGYSETAFAAPVVDAWQVRYFSLESEVPFCGHATIALGAVLAKQEHPGVFNLRLNEANITVEGFIESGQFSAALQSPKTVSNAIPPATLAKVLSLFGYNEADLDPNLPPAFANGGANHLVIGLKSRQALAEMRYQLDAGKKFMHNEDLVTVMFAYAESPQLFHTRNPFASGGVYEDPATGAATAALAGYLRDINWPHAGVIDIVQGEDMGSRSLIRAELDNTPGSSIRVSGAVRFLE